MTKLPRAVLVLVMLILAFASSSDRANLASARSDEQAEFKTLIQRYYAAWNTLDTNNPDQYYAKDADLIFYDIAPLKYNGWSQYKESVQKNLFETISAGKLTPADDLKITRRGNVAWTTLTFHFYAKPKAGAEINLDCRHTAIWEKRGGKWLIVHEHVSAPLPG
jgi:ketosteroid isomerase-like protein